MANRANRYYQVDVINMNTMELNKRWCNLPVASSSELAIDERYLVTVGVTWRPGAELRNETMHVATTTIIPK